MTEFERLSEIVDRVADSSESYTVTRHGVRKAVIVGFDRYESMTETLDILSDEATMAAINEARAEGTDRA